jgi:electron-transferring-flavoprotein dehydrogenase
VIETKALDELLPDWKDNGAPLLTPATDDSLSVLTKTRSFRLPTPPQMNNDGNYIISLANLCRWLAEQAEALGVEIYPGFAVAEVLYDDAGRVKGVATGDMGSARTGKPTENYQPGVELLAKYTLFAEGCRGSLTKTLIERFGLREGAQPQTYGIGVKELWEVDPAKHASGQGRAHRRLADGRQDLWRFVHLSHGKQPSRRRLRHGPRLPESVSQPVHEMQRFKTHPAIRPLRRRTAGRLWRPRLSKAASSRSRSWCFPAAR